MTRRQSHSSVRCAGSNPLGRPGEEPEPQLRHRQALAQAADHDHVVTEPEGRRERRAVPQRRLVRLVGDDHEAVPLGDRDDGGHVLPRGRVAGRVARVAEQQCLRPRSDRVLDRLGIPAPAVRLRAADVDGDAAGRPNRPAEEERRRRHDDLVARLEQRPEADAERLHGAVRDEDLRLGVDAPRRSSARARPRAPAATSRARSRAVCSSGGRGRPRRRRRRDREAQGRRCRATARPRSRAEVPPGAAPRPHRSGSVRSGVTRRG